ncbi:MAG: hypothetical protein AB7I27_16115 [Bacteriovoracaceae bacterium]
MKLLFFILTLLFSLNSFCGDKGNGLGNKIEKESNGLEKILEQSNYMKEYVYPRLIANPNLLSDSSSKEVKLILQYFNELIMMNDEELIDDLLTNNLDFISTFKLSENKSDLLSSFWKNAEQVVTSKIGINSWELLKQKINKSHLGYEI